MDMAFLDRFPARSGVQRSEWNTGSTADGLPEGAFGCDGETA